MEEQLLFPDREEFRRWLLKNHHIHQGFRMVFGKGGKIKTLKPDEALEEALCFGWIDGLIKSIDDEKYLKKFTPRRKGSKWSERNKEIAAKLIENGNMTEHGMKSIEEAKKSGTWNTPPRTAISDSRIEILIKDINGAEPALSNFLKMSLSVRKTYTGFYLAAKKEETRVNRIKKIVDQLTKNNKSPMF
jgi:uncharacterized protein YdeI (YjbR/CyaY-like superfamily)